jgi:hypothetical protein
MVIIGVEEGYRVRDFVAMRVSLCRSAEGCGERVELAFCAVFLGLYRGRDVEIFCSTWNICTSSITENKLIFHFRG